MSHDTAVGAPSAQASSSAATTPPRAATTAVRPSGGRAGAAAGTVWGRSAPIVAALLGIVAIWYVVSYVFLSESRRFLLPPPHQVLAETVGNTLVIAPMLAALVQTITVALIGLTIAVAIGMTWALVMSQWKLAEKILYPYAVILQTIPILALTPLIGIWMGYGPPARVVVCVIIAVFPMISNTLFGLQSATAAAHDLFTLQKATQRQRMTKLMLPAAIPSIFTGLRQSAGLAVIGAIVGDFFFQQGSQGIGGLLRTYTLRLNMEPLFLAIIFTALFGVVVFSIFAALDRFVVGRLFGVSTR
ncbi:NitT/TauT family transport system permease protein [Quadrisphaera granulorum]|uniref:NitT/TauT family transport system permease protein n=1 Tax=Quadrisphaera granulorum TaxID=317664 RepID=A0A316A823_9ACTN|nr:ABC transporter permease [Quadrisphaera granulorum]PWJ53991.1 NitT/TauT family transport system permease protein [Quadrisphaera granulorum]SZE96448.1 NitT/TauT family transport system permease protein [Quadrisphaera granulorum]